MIQPYNSLYLYPMNNEDLIRKFYESFARGDAEGMVSCYDQKIIFTDPAFGKLRGEDAKNMWRMLIERSKGNLIVTFGNIKADDNTGSVNWIAKYVFSQTGRNVVNKISAQFEFQNGKIIRHVDNFNMWRWTQQALGWKGYLLGWTSFVKTTIQKQAKHSLKMYSQKTN